MKPAHRTEFLTVPLCDLRLANTDPFKPIHDAVDHFAFVAFAWPSPTTATSDLLHTVLCKEFRKHMQLCDRCLCFAYCCLHFSREAFFAHINLEQVRQPRTCQQ
ncbi:hypothetical protein [Sinorhizobium meliloti]